MSNSSSIPFASVDLKTIWAYLEEGVDRLMKTGPRTVSYSNYMSLYTVASDYCGPSNLEMDRLPSRTNGQSGADLYNNLIRYFATHLERLRDQTESLQDEALLRYYAAEWSRYTTGAVYVNRLFTYLNHHWIKRERNEGRKAVYPVYTLALVQWKKILFIPVQQKQTKLARAILRLIEDQRSGSVVDQTLIKKVIDSFISLGHDDTDTTKVCLDVYEEHFERPFLDMTEKYYKREAESFLASHTISEYLKKSKERLREEEDRVECYLNTRTRKPLLSICEHVERLTLMWDSFPGLLDFDRYEDLQHMCVLLSRIPRELEATSKKFEEYVTNAGLVAISKLVGEAGSRTDSLDPKVYVDALLEVHQKNSEIVTRSFRGDTGFITSLDKACREFVNRNVATGQSNSRSPELIAKYADLLLRKKTKLAGKDDLEVALNRVMLLFKYIEDKDVFQAFYMTNLSKRLVRGVSVSDESETSMISKLGVACGFGNPNLNKLQHMFTDVSLSKDLTDSFKRSQMEKNHSDTDINFNIMVLGTKLWPLSPPAHEFIIPAEILPTYDRFQKYYQMKHPGRKLTWLWNYSRNELQTNYLNQKYVFMTSSFQMAVLLQYNNTDTLSLSEIIQATSVPKERLSQVLALLVKAKILINEETDQYDLNPSPDFESKRIRVNLKLPIKAEMKEESTEVLKTVDKERKHFIQATIVRIMKARRTMKIQSLIREVISQSSQRFSPKIPDIEKAIGVLLEGEYIEQVEDTRDILSYVA